MSNLVFRDVTFTPVVRNQITYLTSPELAQALGYSQPNAVQKIYNRNKDEFTPEMSVTQFGSAGNDAARLFSLRGAHLIAMFARTPIAKDFRRWVLDVLDRETQQSDIELATAVLRRKRFELFFDHNGKITFHQMPDSPYDGLAKANADPSNIGLEDETIEAIGQACVTALAHRAKCRKECIIRLRGAK